MALSEPPDTARDRGCKAAAPPRLDRAAVLRPCRPILVGLMVAGILGVTRPARADMCFTVSYRFAPRTPPPALARAMEQEASAIWAEYGVRFEWALSRTSRPCGRVTGSFDVAIEHSSRPFAEQPGRRVLGSTHIEPATIDHRPIRIDLRAIEQTISATGPLELLELAHHAAPESSDLGRALGRVLAHEIGHVLLAVHEHEAHGLMRRSFGPGELVGLWPSLTLSIDEVDRLRARERELEPDVSSTSAAERD